MVCAISDTTGDIDGIWQYGDLSKNGMLNVPPEGTFHGMETILVIFCYMQTSTFAFRVLQVVILAFMARVARNF